MNCRFGRKLSSIALIVACLAGLTTAHAQSERAAQPSAGVKPLMAEEAFKNVQVLRGISVSQFMATMGFFAASLGENCTFCHVEESGGNWARYADDNDQKQTARKMILMMNSINQSFFGGKRQLTCYSCHRGGETPRQTPVLADQYSTIPVQPSEDVFEVDPDAPPADQILNKYIRAIGGTQRLSAIKSIAAKGTYSGFDDPDKNPLEIYAQSPNQRTTIVHEPTGDMSSVFDGNSAWSAAPDTDYPIPVVALTGAFLDAARVEAELTFPARIKQTLTNWQVGYTSTIGTRDVQVLQGTSAGGSPVKLYFDMVSGLLVRSVRYEELTVGRDPIQIDYGDYRLLASGVRMPFRWTTTWTDGRSITQLTQVQTNVAINASRFAQPAPPRAPARANAKP